MSKTFFRYLSIEDVLQKGDEVFWCGQWHPVMSTSFGLHPVDDVSYRRPADIEVGEGCLACQMRDKAIGQAPNAEVTPEYLEWLSTKSRSAGVGGNEAWNAGVEFQKSQEKVSDEMLRNWFRMATSARYEDLRQSMKATMEKHNVEF